MANFQTTIGKDVIETLTLGMYEDSRFIYREYIQNAADQIDKAVENGLIKSRDRGKIKIDINPAAKTISIFDNATGIEADKVGTVLVNIAQSTKDRAKHKGFRGIGRLGGLGYCDKLTFETSFKGENIKSTLVWDAKKLKNIINNRETKEEASKVIDSITTLTTDEEALDSHYFRVTLEGVSNKTLLDKDEIRNYLSMVAPVKYNKGFLYKSKIHAKATELDCSIDEYSIFINSDELSKAYTVRIYEGEKTNKKSIDEIYDIQFFEVQSTRGKLIAWGWYSLSTFTKQIPSVNIARGIRLRKGNIQIGSERALIKLFKEPRGTFYFFGEVHAVHPDLIPNARRDYFLETEVLKDLEKQLRIHFIKLHKLYHLSSKLRNLEKKKDEYIALTKEYKEKLNTGFTDKAEKERYEEKLEKQKEIVTNVDAKIEKIESKIATADAVQKKVFDKIVNKNKPQIANIEVNADDQKPKFVADNFTKLTRKERKLISRILAIIDNALPKELSTVLKEKIIEEFSK